MRILYVEDNETNQALVGRVVRARRHKILFCEEGEQALDILKQSSDIDLVLLDIELAGAISGIEVVKQLRADGDQRPVVAVTAYAMMGDRERILEAGCDQYLPKPLVITDLLALIDHYEKVIDDPGAAPIAPPALASAGNGSGTAPAVPGPAAGSAPAEEKPDAAAPVVSTVQTPGDEPGAAPAPESTSQTAPQADAAPDTTATQAAPPAANSAAPAAGTTDEASAADKPGEQPQSEAASPDEAVPDKAAPDDSPTDQERSPERALAEAELAPDQLKEGEQP